MFLKTHLRADYTPMFYLSVNQEYTSIWSNDNGKTWQYEQPYTDSLNIDILNKKNQPIYVLLPSERRCQYFNVYLPT